MLQASLSAALPNPREGDQGRAGQSPRSDEPFARRDSRGLRQVRLDRRRHRARKNDLFRLQEDARKALHVLAGVRHLRRARARSRQDHVLRGAGRAARALQADPRQIQGLRRHPEGQRIPVAALHAVRAVRHAAGSADPHARHAPYRRSGRRGALALQGRRRTRPGGGAARNVALAAKPARDPVGVGRLEGIFGAHQGRPFPRRDLRVHAEGQDHGAAARRDRGGFRVWRAHGHRPPLRRCADQLRALAAAHRAQEWRPYRDPDIPDGATESLVAVVRLDRQSAFAHPPLPEGPAAEGIRGTGRAAAQPGAGDAQGRAGIHHVGPLGGRRQRVRHQDAHRNPRRYRTRQAPVVRRRAGANQDRRQGR